MPKKRMGHCPACSYQMTVTPGPLTCGRCGERLFVPERAATREVPKPVQQKLVLTGREDFDKLVSKGYLPPPTPAMAADLQRRGVVVRERYPLRVGDLIGKVAHALRIPACAGCSKRRMWLNTHLPRVGVLLWFGLLVGVGAGVFKLVV